MLDTRPGLAIEVKRLPEPGGSRASGPRAPASARSRVGEWLQDRAAATAGALLGAGKLLPLDAVIGRDLRVIEIDADSDALGEGLLAAGWRRYLRLRRGSSGNAAGDESRRRTAPYRSAKQIQANNAEVLILSGSSARHLPTFSLYRHVRYVLWAPDRSRAGVAALAGLTRHAARGRIQVLGRVPLPAGDGRTRSYLIGRIREEKQGTRARRYLSRVIGTEEFFDRLNRNDIRYAILRWFDSLPAVGEGEDIDLLVADEQIDRVLGILDAEPGTIPLDVYSASGLPGTDSRSMAYYPPALANQILDWAVLHKGRFRAPSPEHHFLSLAYHAVYHKGERSGLPRNRSDRTPAGGGEHDYAAVLGGLARELGIAAEITLEGLDRCLAERGWRPPLDTLDRLAKRSQWLKSHLRAARDEAALHLEQFPGLRHDGFTVFFLRDKVVHYGLVQLVLDALGERFFILHTEVLDGTAKERVRQTVRGGNWNRGPWPASGGDPAIMVVALDLMPTAASAALRELHPTLTNARLQEKGWLRDRLNTRVPAQEHCNMIHSSDSGPEAAYYLATAAPELLTQINDRVDAAVRGFATSFPVIRDLTGGGDHTKLELIDFHGQFAVKKTFRPGAEPFFEREHRAMSTFSSLRSEVPPVLEVGENFYIRPYYEHARRMHRGLLGLLPLAKVRQAMVALRSLYEDGVSLVDFRPDDLLVDAEGGVKIIRYEYFHVYRTRPPRFEASYDLAGCPTDFEGARPTGGVQGYDALWRDAVGLDLPSLLYDSPLLQHLKRTRFCIARIPRTAESRLRGTAARGRAQVRRVRAAVRRWRSS
ncbi:MAG: hypothetical protein H0X65_00045 [Gemmatimonadetes bacterium]|nr:hypothetical protein [Gemmatimonadota bacterium]